MHYQRMVSITSCLLALLCLHLTSVTADDYGTYNAHDRVPVLANNVGPFHNPAESYGYYVLPFCHPTDAYTHDSSDESFGEQLVGDRRLNTLYEINYKVDVQWRSLCGKYVLTQDSIKLFMDAIDQHYIFEMYVDSLLIRGFVGETESTSEQFTDGHEHVDTKYYLFTHLDFSVAYNDAHVIAVNLTTDPDQRIELKYGQNIDVEFSYSVHWQFVDTVVADRIQLHSKSDVGEQSIEIHWLSIINSFVLVVLLTAFLAVILMRVLRKDVARYMELNDDDLDDDDLADEVGWKLVHGDVFRYPSNVMLFTACIGNGAQLFVLVISILVLAVAGTFYPGTNRGAIYSAAVVLYGCTAFIAGYVATTLYLQLGGSKWATNTLLTAILFAGPFYINFCICNTVAAYYGSRVTLPGTTTMMIILMWMLISLPLTIFGSLRAKAVNGNKPFDAPCKTNRVEREIPPTVWYRHPILQLLIAGFLPFSAIYIELHYIFAAVWGHRVYTLFGILSLAFTMLIIVTAFITVALTYFQLASEQYKWWWRSFLSGSSTGVFMFVYAIFYYMYRSEMNGGLQATFFFGYIACVSYGFSLMLGSVSYAMAQLFVKHIYRSIKID